MAKNKKVDESMSKHWHFHPKLPVGFYPLFDWPPSPKKWLTFIWNYWLQKSDRTIFLLVTLFTYFFLFPPTQEMATLSPEWISKVALRNYIMIFIVAGGLHWWFFIRKGQGKLFQYDTSIRNNKSRKFTFNNSVYDNMFWTLVSGLPIWIFFEVLLLWSFSSGKIATFQFGHGCYGI